MIRTTGPGDPTCGTLAYVAIGTAVVVVVAWRLAVFASGETVLHRVAAPGGRLVAVCQKGSGFDGDYAIRIERPGVGDIRNLYAIGDGDPCSEVVWSPDGQILAVLSEHVGRVRFADVGRTMAHPGIQTAYWSWRQVDLSAKRVREGGAGLRFVGPRSVQIQACSVNAVGACIGASTRRFDIPMPVVTGHNVRPG